MYLIIIFLIFFIVEVFGVVDLVATMGCLLEMVCLWSEIPGRSDGT